MEHADDWKQIPRLKLRRFGGHVIMKCLFLLLFYFQGWCFAHSMITIVSSYLLLHMIGPSIVMVVSMFLFNLVSV